MDKQLALAAALRGQGPLQPPGSTQPLGVNLGANRAPTASAAQDPAAMRRVLMGVKP